MKEKRQGRETENQRGYKAERKKVRRRETARTKTNERKRSKREKAEETIEREEEEEGRKARRKREKRNYYRGRLHKKTISEMAKTIGQTVRNMLQNRIEETKE